MRMRSFFVSFLFLGLILCVSKADACDPCALFNASRLQAPSASSITLSLSEQYTRFKKSSDDSLPSLKDGERVRGYSTSQIGVTYGLSDSLAFQLALPFVVRELDSVKNYRSSKTSDSGFGDLNLVGSYSFLNQRYSGWDFLSSAFAGVKLPTGDTGALEEVSQEVGTSNRDGAVIPKHHQIGSVSGGRALAFGSGSYDYLSGLNFLVRHERAFILSSFQYTLRTEGAFDYQFANDIVFSVVPSYYLLLDDDRSISGGFALSGEYKGSDHLKNQLVNGSAISNLYVGPDFLFTLSSGLGGELALDLRVTDEDAGALVAPQARVRANIFYRF